MSLQPLTPDQREKRTTQYRKWAHWYPLVITMVCAIVIISIAEYAIWNDIALTSQVIFCIVGVGFLAAFYFLFTRIIRRVSKDILENRILFKGDRKPSTRLLLKEDGTYSKEKKLKIISKLKIEGNWNAKIKIRDSKNKAYIESVNNATSHVLEITRPDDILFDRNCGYGFARNLFGGLLIDTLLSLVIMILLLFHCNVYWELFLYIIILEIVLLLFDAYMTYREGMDYAIRLYDVYLEC